MQLPLSHASKPTDAPILADDSPGSHPTFPTWLALVGILLLALVPRIVQLDRFFTFDEPDHWVERVQWFHYALQERKWELTNLTGHPGVTTMWLGTFGAILGEWFGVKAQSLPGNGGAYLAVLRLPLAVVNTLAVGGGYLLLRRLLRPQAALLAALFWACSPYLIGFSRVLHLDGLLASFMTLSLLFAAVYTGKPESQRARKPDDQKASQISPNPSGPLALWLSALCAGLALLTKTPALALLPITGFWLLATVQAQSWRERMLKATGLWLIWLLIALLTIVAIWPAMWVIPREAIGQVINEIFSNGGKPHSSGNYFLGAPTADPGPLFYPAVLLWRSAPWTLLGLLVLPWAARQWETRERRLALLLGGSALLILLALSILPKKLDRYLIPAFPMIEITAALGWFGLLLRIAQSRGIAALRMVRGAIVGFCVLAGIVLVVYTPYYLAFFNPLVGGSLSAPYVMMIGEGEGFDDATAWLHTRPELSHPEVNVPVLRDARIMSWYPPNVAPHWQGPVLLLQWANMHKPVNYAIVYTRNAQRQVSPAAEAKIRENPPLYTVRIAGIDYATIHQMPRPYTTPITATFDTSLWLRGYTLERQPGLLRLTPSWTVLSAMPAGEMLFAHVLGPDGQRVAQADLSIDGGLYPQRWQAGQQFGYPFELALPAQLPKGTYRLVLGVYHAESGARLALTQGTALPAALDGEHVIEVTSVQLP